MGGTSSGKTYSILQLLILIARKKDNFVISVVSESLPHLKKGALKDFEKILREDSLFNEEHYNRTDQKYYFGTSYIEFFSADQPGKATGLRRDILYLNECNQLSYSTVEQMEIRTSDCIFYDYNPTADFWISEKVFTLPANEYVLIKSNYRDAIEMLSPAIARDIELKASLDSNFRKVHIDVEFGMTEGLIFTNWGLCDVMPVTDKSSYGLDFGFSSDPSVLINVRFNQGQMWLNELLFQTGMTNPEIAKFIKGEGLENARIKADSAEPKSIREIYNAGIKHIVGADKGKGSIIFGIKYMQQFRINITKRSVNTIKEFRNYKWKIDNDGKPTGQPIDYFNHSINASWYANEEFQQPKAKPRVTVV